MKIFYLLLSQITAKMTSTDRKVEFISKLMEDTYISSHVHSWVKNAWGQPTTPLAKRNDATRFAVFNSTPATNFVPPPASESAIKPKKVSF